jgi:hypothetical protein
MDDLRPHEPGEGCVADLKMPNGEIVRAAWKEVGRCTAWWPLAGRRKRAIGLYDPVAWRPVANVASFKHTNFTGR